MQRQLTFIYIIFLLLIVGGAAISSGDLPAVMATDQWTWMLRSILMVGWMYVGFITGAKNKLIRASLFILGATYAIVGTLALFNSTVWGLNPHPLVGFELWFHIAVGIAALAVASRPKRAPRKV